MTEDRYEVKGKIGQGGVGAVYRAYDKRLNRDVAIKRVLPEGGYESQEEAIDRFIKEATALSSVQHPHIVTVFDAGVDDDGPYVVMELLDGRTIDEMIERGTLTQEDFREVAVQTQEALIAAQELDLVHRDLKPTNVMVTWMPSGKFQVKIVDFGLAKFSAKPSVQTIDHGDAVFGSIHFMAPEQFERTPLDQRTDMYAMGCLYYFTLTGDYPFTGETAPQVMTAHLQHEVIELKEQRPDLPTWLCDWVMWHLNRKMEDRPQSAREALQHFLMNEQQNPNEEPEQKPDTPPRPKFVFPTADEAAPPAAPPATGGVPLTPDAPPASPAPTTKTAPQPIEPPAGQKPSVHTTSHVTASAEPEATPPAPAEPPAPKIKLATGPTAPPAAATPPPAPVEAAPEPPAPAPVPQVKLAGGPPATPAAPPAASPPAVVPLAGTPPVQAGAVQPTTVQPGVPGQAPASVVPAAGATVITGSTEVAKRKGMSAAAKATIAAVLGLAIIFVGFLLISKMSSNKATKRINDLLAPVADITAKDLPTTSDEVNLLLRQATRLAQDDRRQAIYKRLLVAQASDASDIDLIIAKFASDENNQMVPDIRERLFQVLQGRKGPSALPFLIEYAKNSNHARTATGALKAAEKIATEKDLSDLLNIVQYTPEASVRQAAEGVIASVAKRSDSRTELAAALKASYETAPSEDVKHSYLRLLGTAGGDDAADVIQSALGDANKKTQISAIAALRSWPDDSQFQSLMDYMAEQSDDFMRKQAFEAAYGFLRIDRERDEIDLEDMWKALASEANSTTEKMQILSGMANLTDDWAFSVVEFFEDDDDDKVSFRAEQAKERMESRRKRLDKGSEDE